MDNKIRAAMIAHGLFAAALGLTLAAPALAEVMVGGACTNKDIIDNAVNSREHTTPVAAVKAAGLVGTLKGPGPFTVFVPVNAAFAALPAGAVDALLKPGNKPALVKVLTCHVVSGRITTGMLTKMIADGHGKATLKSIGGGPPTATVIAGVITVTDGATWPT